MKVNTKKNGINDQEKLIVVKRAKEFNDNIVFDMIVNDVTIYGCWLLEGKNGMFVSFPSRKSKDKYYNNAYVDLSEADVSNIIAQIEKM